MIIINISTVNVKVLSALLNHNKQEKKNNE